jgi:hypothetical protein
MKRDTGLFKINSLCIQFKKICLEAEKAKSKKQKAKSKGQSSRKPISFWNFAKIPSHYVQLKFYARRNKLSKNTGTLPVKRPSFYVDMKSLF